MSEQPKRIQLRRKAGGRSKANTYVVLKCRGCERPGAKGQHGFCSPECRFWSKVLKSEGCWTWTGRAHNEKGYGRTDIRGRRWLAHRFAYTLVRGAFPDHLELDHLCKNTLCVNPEHLDPVTSEVHDGERTDQGAHNRGKTHCPRGHEYTLDNTRISSTTGGRHCRACGSPGTGLKGSYNGNAKLTEDTVRQARVMRQAGASVDALALQFGVAQSVMSRALAGRTWAHV